MKIITKLALINVIMFIITMYIIPNIFNLLVLYPIGDSKFMFYQVLTSIFLHGNLNHIIFNMITLLSFGYYLEDNLGKNKLLSLYLLCGIIPNIIWMVLMNSPAIGASGAICGLITSYYLLNTESKVYLFFIIPIKIKYFIYGFALFSLIFSILQYFDSTNGFGIAHLIHLNGIIVGYLITKYWLKHNLLTNNN